MRLYMEPDRSPACLDEAKRGLISLMAMERQALRALHELKRQIVEYEEYVSQALEREEEVLAHEIAERVAEMESGLTLQEQANLSFSVQVSGLKRIVRRLERRLYDPSDRIQTMLDYLDAACELDGQADDRELRRKMRAAGIITGGPGGREVLERVRARKGLSA